jgi:membrane protein YqaA with SNARE-associated domain
MKDIVAWVQGFAMAIGGPGLFVIAFLDSSLLSLPEINDILIVWMVTQHPERMPLYASMATLGSIGGCFLMYWIGAKGGEAFLRRRFSERNMARALNLYRRYGVLAVVVPAILPPPAPFKIFVLMAGVAKMRPLVFALAVAAGRGFRYFAEGLLAMWYGQHAMDYIHEHGRTASLVVAGLIAGGAVAWLIYRRWRS